MAFESDLCEGGAWKLMVINSTINLLLVKIYIQGIYTHTQMVTGCFSKGIRRLSSDNPIVYCCDGSGVSPGDDMEKLHLKPFVKLSLGSKDFPTTPLPATTVLGIIVPFCTCRN